MNLLMALDPLPQGAEPIAEQLRRTCVQMVDRCARLIIEKLPGP